MGAEVTRDAQRLQIGRRVVIAVRVIRDAVDVMYFQSARLAALGATPAVPVQYDAPDGKPAARTVDSTRQPAGHRNSIANRRSKAFGLPDGQR